MTKQSKLDLRKNLDSSDLLDKRRNDVSVVDELPSSFPPDNIISASPLDNSKSDKVLHKSNKERFKMLHRHPFMVPVATFLVLSAITASVFVSTGGKTVAPSDTRIVLLTVAGKQQTIPTKTGTVRDLLSSVGVEPQKGDVIEPSIDTQIVEDGFRVNVYRAKPVVIEDKGRTYFTNSAASSLRSVVSEAGVKLFAEDILQRQPLDNFSQDGLAGERVIVDRATPVNLNLYGSPVTVRTHLATVRDLLNEKQVVLQKNDQVKPALDTPLESAKQVLVYRAGTKIVTEEQEIAPKEEIVDDASLSFGVRVVREEGKPGKRLITYNAVLRNGKVIKKTKIQSTVVREPVNRVVAQGKAVYIPKDKSAWMAAAGLSPSEYPYANFIISHESGWCPLKWQGQVGYCPQYYEELHSPDSGFGYGLCQSTPAGKMASAGSDWRTNAVTQVKWCTGYARGRYGSWEGAYNFWQANRWW